jgi:hypothetical protein
MNGSLTPFLDEAMVSPHRTLSAWFPKTLYGTAMCFCEPPRKGRFPHTIPRRGNGFPTPYTLRMVPENPLRDCYVFL